ncbi:MAG TPA: alpha/beta hydrolase [Sandaracinaceae bacterium]
MGACRSIGARGLPDVAVDLPDFGYDAPGTTTASFDDRLCELLTSLEPAEPIVLVGHSFGAWVAARALARSPVPIARAVLIGGLPSMPAETAQAYRQGADALQAGALPRAAFEASVLDAAFTADDPPAMRELAASILARYPDDRLIRALRLVAALDDPLLGVERFDVPAVVLHGERDASVPPALGRALASLGSRAELEVWPGAGHMLPLTHAERVARAVYA